MEVTESIYTWLGSLGFLEYPGIAVKEKYKISEQDSEKLELGLILPIIKPYVDSLPNEEDLKHTNLSVSRLYNWNLLLKPLESIGVEINSDTKSLITAGDRMQVVEVLKSLKIALDKFKKKKNIKATFENSVLLNNLDPESKFIETESLLEFLVLSFCKTFKITPKISAGLLAQNYNFLAQVIVKGLKRDFLPIINWYEIVMKNYDHLLRLIEKEKGSLKLIFKCLKPGLESKSTDVNLKAMEALYFFNEKLKNFEKEIWQWASLEDNIFKSCFSLIELKSEITKSILRFLLNFGKNFLNEIFVISLQDFCGSTYNYIIFIQKWFKFIVELSASDLFQNSGIIELWIDLCVKEIDIDNKNQNNRAFYLGFLCDLWTDFSSYLQLIEKASNNILATIKKISREGSRSIKLLIFGRTFLLLSVFSHLKNSYAPIIYKTLSFCTLENYLDEPIREFMLINMIEIFNSVPSIPIGVLVEPLIKQIHSSQNFQLLISDFDFFIAIARHPRLGVKEAILLIDLCGKLILSQSIYITLAEIPFLLISANFIETKPIQEYILKFIKLSFKLRYEGVENSDDLNKKMGKNMTAALLEKIIRFGNIEVNNSLKELFITLYSDIKKLKDKKMEYLYKILFEFSNDLEIPIIFNNSPQSEALAIILKNDLNLKVITNIERIKQKRLIKENNERQKIEQKSLKLLLEKKNLRKEIDRRKMELGIKSKIEDNESVILLEINGRSSGTELYRMSEEIPEELELIKAILKKYSKVCKILFNKFSGSAYKNKVSNSPTFDKLKKSKEYLSESDLSRMLKCLNLFTNKFTIEDFKTVYIFLVTKLRVTEIQYEHFPELLYLIAILKQSKEESSYLNFPQAYNLEIFFQSIKNNGGIVPVYYFEEPDFGYGDRDVANSINKKLLNDPDYPIPENYKKFKELNFQVSYKVFFFKESKKIALELIDELLWKSLSFHLLMPVVEKIFMTRVKGLMGMGDSRNPSSKFLPKIESIPGFAKLSPSIKFHAVSLNHMPIDSLMECAKLIDDLIYSIEKNSFILISKLPKPAGTISNRITQEKIIKEIEKHYESQRLEKKRKQRIKIVNEEATQIKLQREYQEYLEKEAKKKEAMQEKIQAKIKKQKDEKRRFEIEEKILEYKLSKIENEVKSKNSSSVRNKIIKLAQLGEKKMSTSVDFSEKSHSTLSRKNEKNKATSVPRIAYRKNFKNY